MKKKNTTKNYEVRNGVNGIEILTRDADGKAHSVCGERQLIEVKDADGNVIRKRLESRKECINRLKAILGI